MAESMGGGFIVLHGEINWGGFIVYLKVTASAADPWLAGCWPGTCTGSKGGLRDTIWLADWPLAGWLAGWLAAGCWLDCWLVGGGWRLVA